MPQSFHMHYFEIELSIHNLWAFQMHGKSEMFSPIIWCPMKQNLQLKSMSETQLAHAMLQKAIEEAEIAITNQRVHQVDWIE